MAHDAHKPGIRDVAQPANGGVLSPAVSASLQRFWLVMLATCGVFAGPLVLASLLAFPIGILATGAALGDPVVQWVGGLTLLVHGIAAWGLVKAKRARREKGRLIGLSRLDAPHLYAMISTLAQRIDAPEIDRVLVSTELNASVSQSAAWFGIFGTRQELTIGLPLLQSLAQDEFAAVLAHELAHCRRSDGRLHALVFRARQRWMQIEQGCEESRFVGRGALRWIAGRYLRQMNVLSARVIREGEFAADAISAKTVGASVLARALVRVTHTREVLQRLWDTYWLANVTLPAPKRGPWHVFTQELPRRQADLLPESYWLQFGHHPSIAERMARLGVLETSRLEVSRPVGPAAIALLGESTRDIVAHFDQQWWAANQARWTDFYEGVPDQRERLSVLDRAAASQSLTEATAIERAVRAEYLLGVSAAVDRYRWCLYHFPSSGVARYNLDELLSR